jgi:hypothetical protein
MRLWIGAGSVRSHQLDEGECAVTRMDDDGLWRHRGSALVLLAPDGNLRVGSDA